MLTILRRREHRTGCEARKNEIAHAHVEAADHMDVVGDLSLVAVHRPVADVEPLADEVLGIRTHEAAVELERASDMMNHHPALRQRLRLRETADRVDVEL